jgi:D-beta-D-heptose 7-phosphate kinase/D-beta-D-heptose 1-phosphate adenosyltransferase
MSKHHTVIGDLILDRFVYGSANRVSAEAPTLVLDVEDEIDMLGGAYNVAAHICNLEHTCDFISVSGNNFGLVMSSFTDSFHPNCKETLYFETARTTTVKTRLISKYKGTHLLRVDRETIQPIRTKNEDNIIRSSSDSLKNKTNDIILVDYKKGVVTDNLAETIITNANRENIPVYVDTKRDNLDCFEGATIVKPNKYEFEKIKLRYAPHSDMEDACYTICSSLSIQKLVITAGNEGIYAFDLDAGLVHCTAEKVEVKELSGAGDSVLAVLSYCLSEGYDFKQSVIYANKLAGKFISSGIQYRAKKEDLFCEGI